LRATTGGDPIDVDELQYKVPNEAIEIKMSDIHIKQLFTSAAWTEIQRTRKI